MQLTNESLILLDYFNKNINYPVFSKNLRTFLKYVYDSFEEFNKYNIDFDSIRSINKYKHKLLEHNDFFAPTIVNYINKKILISVHYSLELHGRKIDITYYIFNKEDYNFKYLDYYTHQVFMILNLLQKHSNHNCNKSLNINIYLTPFKRVLPHYLNDIIGPVNINGGYAYSCIRKGSITVYRKQEWFKVLIHECFHSYGLDFSTMHQENLNDKFKKIMPIKSKINLFETYCEIWAEILNVCTICYLLIYNEKLNKKESIERFTNFFGILIQVERKFSFFQTAKILNYQKLLYKDLFKKNNTFKENTNVFAYYIVKSLIYYDYEKFIDWCSKNNYKYFNFTKTFSTLESFFKFVEGILTNRDFINIINKNQEIILKKYKLKSQLFILNNLRMTSLEFKY